MRVYDFPMRGSAEVKRLASFDASADARSSAEVPLGAVKRRR